MPLTTVVEHMHDLAIELQPDGHIRLEQEAGSLEGADTILLHPAQIRLIAERAGLLAPARPSAQHQQERALRRLWCKLDLMAADCWLDEIVDRVGEGLAYRGYAHDAMDTLEGIMEDLGIAIPASVNEGTPEELSNKNSPPPRNEKSSNENSNAAISVTPKRGRPATGQALSSAERQARHRARQAELIPADDEVVAEGATE